MRPRPAAKKVREYLVFPAPDDWNGQAGDSPEQRSILVETVNRYVFSKLSDVSDDIELVDVPTLNWNFLAEGVPEEPPELRTVIAVLAVSSGSVEKFRNAAAREFGPTSFGSDVAAFPTEYWCPMPEQTLFGNRAAARTLIGANALDPALRGDGVNVVVVDQGLDRRLISGNFAGGWRHRNPETGEVQLPGMTRGEEARHATMIVRNILDIAPHARIWDFPLIPPRIWDLDMFVADAHAAYAHVLHVIRFLSHFPAFSGPWVLVNAWAIFDRRSESIPGDYTNRLDHPFNLSITKAANDGHDSIFCAGNCGQFCPDPRCGPRDQGPGQSIYGANSHPRVISVGAVRTDARWFGYSSQGPGQPNLAVRKPDLCAPSGFSENNDAYTPNTGTSAAAGITAGVVAALRSKWGTVALPPDALRIVLNLTARKTEGPGWNGRLGHGILHVPSVLEALENVP
jgi:hypothetical protein